MAVRSKKRNRKPKHLKNRPKAYGTSPIDHAVRIIHAVCGLAGSPTLIDEIRAELRAEKVLTAIRNRQTGPVFDWLLASLVAFDYAETRPRELV